MAGPHHVRQCTEDAVHVGSVRRDQPVRQQVQTKICVVGVGGRLVERGDHGTHRHRLDIAFRVGADQGGQLVGRI